MKKKFKITVVIEEQNKFYVFYVRRFFLSMFPYWKEIYISGNETDAENYINNVLLNPHTHAH